MENRGTKHLGNKVGNKAFKPGWIVKETSNPILGIIYGFAATGIGVTIVGYIAPLVVGSLFALIHISLGLLAQIATFYLLTTRWIPSIAVAFVNQKSFNGFAVGFMAPVAVVVALGLLLELLTFHPETIAVVLVLLLIMSVGLVNLKTKVNAREVRRLATAESISTSDLPQLS